MAGKIGQNAESYWIELETSCVNRITKIVKLLNYAKPSREKSWKTHISKLEQWQPNL